ncbi:hypothetical protein POUND7_010430 [Theobroma cacao]
MGCFCQKTCLGFDYFSEPDTWTGLSATWDRIEDLMDLKANLPTKLIEKPSLEFKGNSCRLSNMISWEVRNRVVNCGKRSSSQPGQQIISSLVINNLLELETKVLYYLPSPTQEQKSLVHRLHSTKANLAFQAYLFISFSTVSSHALKVLDLALVVVYLLQ